MRPKKTRRWRREREFEKYKRKEEGIRKEGKKKSIVVKKITAYEKLYQKVKNLIESLEK